GAAGGPPLAAAGAAAALATRGTPPSLYHSPNRARGATPPAPPHLAHATVRAAVSAARQALPKLALIAGGKSFGGRMTSQTQARAPLPDVRGLAFLGFPLHPAGKPSRERAEHLFAVQIPMLFLQGTRDTLAALDEIEPVCQALGARATLKLFADADHSFHVPARSGRNNADVLDEVLDALVGWIDDRLLSGERPPAQAPAR